jgi:GT2 family glycosyltransferase
LHGGAVTVIIPTLAADGKLCECLEGLGRQTRRDFDVVVVDNSGKGLARQQVAARPAVRVIENKRNLGF